MYLEIQNNSYLHRNAKVARGKFLLVIAFAFLSTTAFSQKEAYTWYFGGQLGLDFSKTPPKLLSNSSLNTYEGCSTISDEDGNVLFYTDGVTVWDSRHRVMDNGDDLNGHSSSTQSGLIVAKPEDPNTYYVFTVDASENFMRNGLQYALIDLSANNGYGAVTEKYNTLMSPGTEKVTGVIHKNGRDIWIISHKWDSDEFHSFLLTKEGMQDEIVISKVGSEYNGDLGNAIGYLKASSDGGKIASAIYQSGLVEVFDFDIESGKLSNPKEIYFKAAKPYGIEFSPNGELIYISTHFDGGIYQYNLNSVDISLSKKTIRKPDDGNCGSLQIGPDGRIYIQLFQKDHLGVIKEPDNEGRMAKYVEAGIYLGSKEGRYGLPTFVQSFFTKDFINEISTYYLDFKLTSGNQPFQVDTIIVRKGGIINSFTEAPKELILKSDEVMDLTFKKKGYFNQKMRIDSSNVEEYLDEDNNLNLNIDMQEIVKDQEVKLDDIYYNYNSSELRDDAGPALEKLLDMLQDNPDISIQINAHTDCRGSDTYNEDLSQKRAQSVVNYLINNGISVYRLQAKGFGEKSPVSDCACANCSDEEFQQDRRTTFSVR